MSRRDDARLMRESLRFASPHHLDALLQDRRRWVRCVARAEEARRAREEADEVVCREPLRMMVRSFAEAWRSERPGIGGRFSQTGRHLDRSPVTFVSAYQWLSTESGVSLHVIENISRPTARSSVVPLGVADSLLCALGDPGALAEGRVRVVSRSAAASCCSGSETTAARA